MIESLININGYYTIAKPIVRHHYTKPLIKLEYEAIPDTIYINYLFFSDGIFLRHFHIDYCSDPKCIPEKFKELVGETISNKYFYGDWGGYTVCGDTIITQYIHRYRSLNDGWRAWETHFRIIDRNTIIEFYSKPLHRRSKSDLERWNKYNLDRKYLPAVFIPTETIPNSDCWLKYKQWFWMNDSIRIENM
jgi:hypothetical protein